LPTLPHVIALSNVTLPQRERKTVIRVCIYIHVYIYMLIYRHHVESLNTTPKGFEPLRAEPNGFLVHLLNHSDKVSCDDARAMLYYCINF
jgi:hypothetical protein